MHVRRLGVIVAIGLGLLPAAACNRSGTGGGAASDPRVALVMKTSHHPFFLDMQRGAEEAALRLGVRLVAQAPDREIDVERQVQIIENLVQTGIQALCVTPSGSREIVSALLKAQVAGIPVIVVDTRVDPQAAAAAGLTIQSFIGSDNYEGGRLAARFLVEATSGRARVAILEGVPGHETSDSRVRGFRDALDGLPGLAVVASQPANMERELGFTVFQNIMQAHPDVDALFACNDLMALGAVEAIAAAGRTGRIRVVGFDAIEDARQAIEAGRMSASVAQSPREMGRIAIEAAVQAIRGSTLPRDQPVPIHLVTREGSAHR
jgi:ribose transport system substrate-binding protein